jgi:hypothetical protein
MWSRRLWHQQEHDSSTTTTTAATAASSSATSKTARSSRTVSTTTTDHDSKQSSFDEEDESSIASSSDIPSRRRERGVPAMVMAEQSSPVCSPVNSTSADPGNEKKYVVNETSTESSSLLDCTTFARLMRTAEAALSAGELRDGLEFYGQAVDFLVQQQQQSSSNVPCSLSGDHGANIGETTIITIANLCYTCSRISRRLRDYQAAYRFGTLELHYVNQHYCLLSEVVVAYNHQDLAYICHYELGDSVKALEHYRIALGLHQGRLQNLRQEVSACLHCKSFQVKALCQGHKAAATEMLSNVQETKECIGRIQFGLGMVADAMTMF